MIALTRASARGAAERGRPRPALVDVSLEHGNGVLVLLGSPKDGTSLACDLLDGSARPSTGTVTVHGGSPERVLGRIARVALAAPLPEALRVGDVCDLASDLRAEPRVSASERLGALGLGALARRRVRTLTLEERRAVAFAIALTSTKADVLLLEEPLVMIDPVAPRLLIDILRRRAASACIVATTASARDAVRLADRLALLSSGVLTPVMAPELTQLAGAAQGATSVRVLVAPTYAKEGAATLAGVLGADDAVTRVETSGFAVTAHGVDAGRLARAVTRAIARANIDVELIEPGALPLDALRTALAARDASPPPGSLPPSGAAPPPSAAPPPPLPDLAGSGAPP